MQSQENKTKMVAPQDATNMVKRSRTLIVAYPGTEIPEDKKKVTDGMVRIKAVRGIADGDFIYSEGTVLDVTPDYAKEYCDKVFTGSTSHVGETLTGNAKHHEIVRAVRVS